MIVMQLRLVALMLFICVMAAHMMPAWAATATSRQSGNWNQPATWSLTRTGTITASTGSATVTGAGTLFTTELAPNDVIMNAAGAVIGTVLSITDNLNLTLAANAAVNVGAQAYTAQRVPAATDVAVIPDLGHTITLPANATIAGVTVNGGVQATTLRVNADVLMTVNGNLTVNAPTAAVAKIIDVLAAGSLRVTGNLTLSGGAAANQSAELRMADSQYTRVTVNGNVAGTTAGGSFNARAQITFAGQGMLDIGGNLASGATLTSASGTIGFFGGNAQSMGSYNTAGTTNNFNHIMVNKSGGTVTPAGNLLIRGDFFNNNASRVGAGTCTNPTFRVVTFAGTAVQNLLGPATQTNFCRVVLDNANGLTLTSSTNSLSVANQLTLTNGRITTQATNAVFMGAGATVVGAVGAPQNRYIAGNLRKVVPSGSPTVTWEVGSPLPALAYAPIVATFTAVTASGDVTGATFTPDHPSIGSSALNASRSVNRWWRLSGSLTYQSYAPTFNFLATDVDAAANTSALETEIRVGGTWFNSLAGTRTATSTQATGITAFGDFAVAEKNLAGLGAFNAFEPVTLIGETVGVINTKIAGVAFTVTLVPLTAPRTAVDTGYSQTVRVELLNASNNSGALDANGCRSTWTVIQTLGTTPSFPGSGNNRINAVFTEPNSWPNVRVRITALTGPARIGCSNDNFAIRPAWLTNVILTDNDSVTAGLARTLNNLAPNGGDVHKAGRPFTVRATAQNASSVLTSNYAGNPSVRTLACTLPAGCTSCSNGTMSMGTFSGSGTRTSNTASYSEAGTFNLTLIDQTFAGVDVADTPSTDSAAAPTGRWIPHLAAPLAVGRFIPDNFALTTLNTPVFRTFDMVCTNARSFTYIGTPFGYSTAPIARVTARNAANGTTTNYRQCLFKLTPAMVTQTYTSVSGPLDATLVSLPTVAAGTGTPDPLGSGRITVDRDGATNIGVLRYTRNVAAVQANFAANIALAMTAIDDSENAVVGNGTISTASQVCFNGGTCAAPGSGIAFDAGNQFYYGRLRLQNAFGSQLVPLRIPVQAQYWNGAAFVSAPDNCSVITTGNVALGDYTGNLNAGETTPSIAAGPLLGGAKVITLSAPGQANSGSVAVSVNLTNAAAGASCVPGMSASTGSALTHLQGAWCLVAPNPMPLFDRDPTARATFGIYKSPAQLIYQRENFGP